MSTKIFILTATDDYVAYSATHPLQQIAIEFLQVTNTTNYSGKDGTFGGASVRAVVTRLKSDGNLDFNATTPLAPSATTLETLITAPYLVTANLKRANADQWVAFKVEGATVTTGIIIRVSNYNEDLIKSNITPIEEIE